MKLGATLRFRAIFLAAIGAFFLSSPVSAANWGSYYIYNDQFGRCGDGRLTPDTRVAECIHGLKFAGLSSYGMTTLLDGLANAFLDKSDYANAIAVYDKAVKTTTNNDQAFQRYLRARAYLNWGKTDVAYDEFTKLLQDSGSTYAYAGVADVAADRGQYGDALKYYGIAITKLDTYAYYLIGRASVFARMGEYENAMKDDDTAVGDDSNSEWPYRSRCWHRAISNRDLDAALADCNRSLEILPDYFDTLDTRGLVRFRQGRWDDAIADYDAALRHDPQSASALFMRGIAEMRKGDHSKGQADIAQAEAIYPRISAQYAVYGIAP